MVISAAAAARVTTAATGSRRRSILRLSIFIVASPMRATAPSDQRGAGPANSGEPVTAPEIRLAGQCSQTLLYTLTYFGAQPSRGAVRHREKQETVSKA